MKLALPFRSLLSALVVTGFSMNTAAFAASDDSAKRLEGVEEQLEQVDRKVDGIAADTASLKKSAIDQPLGARRQGVELNLFRIIASNSDEGSISGTYSRFDTEHNVEWAVPVFYQWHNGDRATDADTDRRFDSSTFNIDLHYRRYLGHRLDGFYLSGFSRLAQLHGMEDGGSKVSSELKAGLGVGLGWRKISANGLYWGMSVSLGRYLVGESEKFADSGKNAGLEFDNMEYILDVEFLKFGYAF